MVTSAVPPIWLKQLAIGSLALAMLSALVIACDLLVRNRQTMWIMNVVWIITGLWAGPLALWGYFRVASADSKRVAEQAKKSRRESPHHREPTSVAVAKATTHCGSGCTLGDICAEWFASAVPFTLFGKHLFGSWVYDYVLAFAFGILFQYFTIKPMKHLSAREGLKSALQADSLSLTAWQLGMYGWMAIATFALFRRELAPTSPVFWFMMQIGMIAGFFTSYPINCWLVRRGIKERM